MKKLPPYGKELFLLQQKGERPHNSIYVYIGLNAWKLGSSSYISRPARTLLLPPWEDPDVYDWPVDECDVLICKTSWADSDYIDDVVKSLFIAGATRAILLDYDHNTIFFHKE